MQKPTHSLAAKSGWLLRALIRFIVRSLDANYLCETAFSLVARSIPTFVENFGTVDVVAALDGQFGSDIDNHSKSEF